MKMNDIGLKFIYLLQKLIRLEPCEATIKTCNSSKSDIYSATIECSDSVIAAILTRITICCGDRRCAHHLVSLRSCYIGNPHHDFSGATFRSTIDLHNTHHSYSSLIITKELISSTPHDCL